MHAAGAAFGRANVAAIYLVHGTICGNDVLGLLTELARIAPELSEQIRKLLKGGFDAVVGETSNFTHGYAQRMEQAISVGAGRTIPVRRFHWSGHNTHIARADGAVRLIDQLARHATELMNVPAPSPRWGGPGRGDEAGANTAPGKGNDPDALSPRIMVWAHSHGGNALALATNLLGGDLDSRRKFFDVTRPFHRGWRRSRSDFAPWERVEALLLSAANPLGGVALDLVTLGTPIRYGWETGGYSKLLHITNHRPMSAERHWLAPYPPRLLRALAGKDGDVIQQVGIAGTGFPANPLAFHTFAANMRLRNLLSREPRQGLISRLRTRTRVPDEGPTLLVDYDDPAHTPIGHFFGHACYTRSHWLPLHCELVSQEFYGSE